MRNLTACAATAFRDRLVRSNSALGSAILGRAGLTLALTALAGCAVPRTSASVDPPQLRVSGNALVNSRGAQVVLRGVDRSGTEFECVQGNGIFDGPSSQASITAMRSWHVNAVRVPLNQACWDGEAYVKSAYAGSNYQSAIESYVSLLNSNGIIAILDLHWSDGQYLGPSSACSSARAVCQKPMPNAGAIQFWKSVARAFKDNKAVIFDLFNEPYPEVPAHGNETEGWQCWLHGGTCTGISYRVAGMQSLVNAVRSTGADNVIMAGGLAWANDLTGWLSNEPVDPDHNLVASWHSYNFNACNNESCWASQIGPVIARVPVIVGEMGENNCVDSYMDRLMPWLDSQSTSYLAWAWDVARGKCPGGSDLIANYDGQPTRYGRGFESHLRSLSLSKRAGRVSTSP